MSETKEDITKELINKIPKNLEEAKNLHNEKIMRLSQNHLDSVIDFITSRQPNIKIMKLVKLSIDVLKQEFININKRIAENHFKYNNNTDPTQSLKLLDAIFTDLMENTIISQSMFLLIEKIRDIPKEEVNELINETLQTINKDKTNNDKQYDNNYL